MGFLNKARIDALFKGDYICDKCGNKMEFEDKNEDVLVCPSCGNSMDLDHYGFKDEEEYEAQFRKPDGIIEEENDEDESEYYEEELNELGD